MQILFVIPYFHPALQYGGQPRAAYELARGLTALGHSVKVLTTDSLGEHRLPKAHTVSTFHDIDVIYYRNLSNYLAFRHRIFLPTGFFSDVRRQIAGSDIVHIHELRSLLTVAAALAARGQKVPYVLSPHGGLRHLGRALLKTVFDELWGNRILAKAAGLFAVSPVESQDALELHVERKKIRIVPNGINPEDYGDLPQPGAFRSRWELADEPVVLFLGRLHWIKGADLLVAAVRRLCERGENVQLVLAGPDDGHETEIRGLVTRYNLARRTTFTGFLDHRQKLEALVDASIVVIPSRSEVFAITALEALLCSRPVLLSSVCGLNPKPGPEHGVLTFDSENVCDLADKIMFSLRVTRAGTAQGRQFAIREFSIPIIAQKVESAYREILDMSRRMV